MRTRLDGTRVLLVVLLGLLLAALPVAAAFAAGPEEGEEDGGPPTEFVGKTAARQFSDARLAPGGEVTAGAFRAAQRAADALPVAPGSWTEVTTKPYLNDHPGFRDPNSNSGAGWGLVSGRLTDVAVSGRRVFVASAAGGVWRSTNGGTTFQPVFDDQPSMSVGSLALEPGSGALWVGTGEANTNADSYLGQGVLRSADGGRSFERVGGTQLEDHLIGRITFDGAGRVYAATSKGLYRRSLSAPLTAPWQRVLRPGVGPYGTTFVNDVKVQPGTGGKVVIANVAWRNGTPYNGFYRSTTGGSTWRRVTTTGALDSSDIGRSTFAYSPDGSTLYAVVQSVRKLLAPSPEEGFTVLGGVFKSESGSVAGPWTLIADQPKLEASGSAIGPEIGYGQGIQAWYNQFLQVDPADPKHVYLGLEEVFETRDGGATWNAIGPYWNFGLPCYQGGLEDCLPTTHPDQHGVTVAGGRVYVANDGGLYSQPSRGGRWFDHNRTLRTLQYYGVQSGRLNGGEAIWGGLQDNGESLLFPGSNVMVSPFGGDGGDTLVDPDNGARAVEEYTYLDMSLTTNAGRTSGSPPAFREISPSCFAFGYTPDPCDESPRFIAPFEADDQQPFRWVAGGRFVWETTKGWATTCGATACDWKIVHDTGDGHTTTALDASGGVTYAAWCAPAPNCNPDGAFDSGIATDAGGTWHAIDSPVLPNRFIQGLTVDPADTDHVYAVFNGFSRRWIEGGGTGHVFESTDAGAHWTDISGDLPDAPGDDLELRGGRLILATDIGVFTADAGQGAATRWSVLGTRYPHGAPTVEINPSTDGRTLLAATHGRGIWRLRTP